VLRLSILHGAFPWVLAVAAFAALIVGIGWRDHRWRWKAVPLQALGVAAFASVAAALGHVEQRVGSHFPRSFYLWGALPLFAAVVATTGWRRARHLQRGASILAVPLLIAFGLVRIDAHYAYLPTLGDVLGTPMPHEVRTPTPRRPLSPDPPPTINHGEVVEVDIPSSKRFVHRPGFVWLPPAWFVTPRPRLPVVELMAGVPGQPDNMIRAATADGVADAYAAGHAGVAPILVFPDHNGSFTGDTECVDGPRGAAETYLLTDIPKYMRRRFDASSGPSHLAIVGYSEGGTCAVTLALRHPDLVGTFVDIGGDIRPNLGLRPGQEARTVAGLYGGDASQWPLHDPLHLLASHRYPSTAGWFEDGLSDAAPLASARELVAGGKAAGMATVFVPVPGGHSFAFASKAVADSFPWLASRLGLS